MKNLFKFLFGIVFVIIIITCTKEYNWDFNFPESSDTIIVSVDTVFISPTIQRIFTETDYPTEFCEFGETVEEFYVNGELVFFDRKCKDSVPSGQEPCNNYWYYQDNTEGCDTFYVYDCHGDLLLAQPICPEIIVEPGDTTEINHACFFYDFNTGSTPGYEAIGFENFNASESDGTNRFLFLDEYPDETIAWTKYPVYLNENSNTDTISVRWGSSWKYYIELIEESRFGEEKVIYGKIVGPVENFNVYKEDSYEIFNYPFPKGDYTGKRFWVRVRNLENLKCNPSRNQQFNITEIYLGYSWVE